MASPRGDSVPPPLPLPFALLFSLFHLSHSPIPLKYLPVSPSMAQHPGDQVLRNTLQSWHFLLAQRKQGSGEYGGNYSDYLEEI